MSFELQQLALILQHAAGRFQLVPRCVFVPFSENC
jgi:hypothetical protein